MHRRPGLRRPGATLLAGALVLGLGGCSSGVEVSPAPGASTAGCRDIATHWPQRVGTLERRDLADDVPTAAAWGDPAVVARCGVSAIPPTTTECIESDGVGWIPEQLTDGWKFTSFGTDPALEVLVPQAYDPGSLLLPAFTAAARSLPRNGLECR